MTRKRRLSLAAPPPDPFGEHRPPAYRERFQVLGGDFNFGIDSARLRALVRTAYSGLPPHQFRTPVPQFWVRLLVSQAGRARRAQKSEPPPMKPLAGGGFLAGVVGRATFVSVSPEQRTAMIVISRDMLRYAYHLRYELIEFAVYVLAARAQGLVPLHAGCIGSGKQGILLIGPSGAGKSTLVVHALLSGLDLLAEDSVLINPEDMRATGVANFVHLRRDSLRFLTRLDREALLAKSSVIRRRSGVSKLEIDLRHSRFPLAAAPLAIRALVFLSSRRAGRRPLMTPLSTPVALKRLAASQRYAAHQAGWSKFIEHASRLPAYELQRGTRPGDAVEEVSALIREGLRPAGRAAHASEMALRAQNAPQVLGINDRSPP